MQGAEFKIVRNSTGETWVVNTDIDGKVLSDILVIDEDYTITEIKAPTGYILNNKPYKVHLTAKGIVLTLKNRIETEKTSVNVKKTWEGTKTGPVTVNLLANGLKRSSVVLSDGNNWKHTFMDLDKYDNYGNKIIYTPNSSHRESSR